MKKYLIIGNGVAGTTAAEFIRKQDVKGKITIVTEEALPFYYRIRLNEYISADISEQTLVAKKQQWFKDNDIDLKLRTRIAGAEPQQKVVVSENNQKFYYDFLLIATGSHSFVPPIKGYDLKGVFTLRTIKDAHEISSFAKNTDNVVLIGGGLLGLEIGYALRKLGKKVTVVEFFPRLLPRQLDVDGAFRLQQILKEMGFFFRIGAKTLEIIGDNQITKGVLLEGGEVLAADMIIISAGVRSNLELADALELDKQAVEKAISQQMAIFTADDSWKHLDSEVKTLTLEHHMAARRSGFIDFFEPLYKSSSDSTGLLDGTMSGIPFLTNQLLPLIKAKQAEDEFAVAQIVKKYSPLLDKKVLKDCDNQIEQIKKADSAVESLMTLWKEGSEPSLLATIKKIFELNLFSLPEHFLIIAKRIDEEFEVGETEDEQDKLIDAWDEALNSSFSQLERYSDYISDNSPFGTHQGIKGLEFPRVMVILDDEEARGFLFSYEKLFGAKEPTATDKRNENEGKETSIDRTRRLFYVTCSRAEKSLAIVAYTKEPEKVYRYVLTQGWFGEDELITDQ
ncbi:MAG: FAD-dependent oxidoreductase [Deltaproteobacteria bacterium]|jgi:thioredoxin reductase|nr:FAD-dependent oxidoreductase [Deltaproteobacteria bacterium]